MRLFEAGGFNIIGNYSIVDQCTFTTAEVAEVGETAPSGGGWIC